MPRPPRLHVVGSSPRSGTTLAFELLTSCFEIEKFGDHEISLFERPPGPSGPYASKMPNDFIHVKRVMRWDPQLYCLFMERDPRDIVVSQHGKRPGEYWCDFPIWQRHQKLLDGLRDHPRILICRYEDLVRDPDTEQARIAQAFPFLTQRHAYSDFHKVAQSSEQAEKALGGVRKISAQSVGTWQKNLPRIAGQLAQYPAMAEAVVTAGYDTDPNWSRICDGVTLDQKRSVRLSDKKNLSRRHGPDRHMRRALRRIRSLLREGNYILRSVTG